MVNGEVMEVLTRVLNPPLCLLKSELLWTGMGQVDLKEVPPDGCYQANRGADGKGENEAERGEYRGCH